jgi:hypothetical protein
LTVIVSPHSGLSIFLVTVTQGVALGWLVYGPLALGGYCIAPFGAFHFLVTATQGVALGWLVYGPLALGGYCIAPFGAFHFLVTATQGVALGWLVCGPLALGSDLRTHTPRDNSRVWHIDAA